MTLPAALNHRFPGSDKMAQAKDFVEGPRAFAEKRKPNWTGA
jgi:crotonobetainyl-CoA hydratase